MLIHTQRLEEQPKGIYIRVGEKVCLLSVPLSLSPCIKRTLKLSELVEGKHQYVESQD